MEEETTTIGVSESDKIKLQHLMERFSQPNNNFNQVSGRDIAGADSSLLYRICLQADE